METPSQKKLLYKLQNAGYVVIRHSINGSSDANLIACADINRPMSVIYFKNKELAEKFCKIIKKSPTFSNTNPTVFLARPEKDWILLSGEVKKIFKQQQAMYLNQKTLARIIEPTLTSTHGKFPQENS